VRSSSLAALAIRYKNSSISSTFEEYIPLNTSPESLGISSQSIIDFLKAANESGIHWHSYVLMRHGKIASSGAWKPWSLNNKHTLYSLSKSFTSTAIGLLVDEGKIKVTDPIINYFREDTPSSISENLHKMTIHHLLSMNVGHDTECIEKFRTTDEKWEKIFLNHEVVHEPGTHFLYNTPSTYMLGSLVNKVTGMSLLAYLKPRIFMPLGITDYDWEVNKQDKEVAGWGLRLKPTDVVKLGQLYLQKGKYNGKQIISEAWVNMATQKQTESQKGNSDWSQGYGYQFWRCKHNLYRGDGAFGQYCIVMPDQDAVLVVNSETPDMQKNLNIIYEHLLPAMTNEKLPEDKAILSRLRTMEASLKLLPQQSSYSPKIKTIINFTHEDNSYGLKKTTIKERLGLYTFTFTQDKAIYKITAGIGKWSINEGSSKLYLFGTTRRNPKPSDIAASAIWLDERTLQLELRFIEAIHGDKLTFYIDGDNSYISFLGSLSEMSTNNKEERLAINSKLA
jgi:CubicO group peptidase (beta-lactamase class C family)